MVRGYAIGPMLGRGGTSSVFAARHPKHRRPLAFKVMLDERLRTRQAGAAIYSHTRALGALRNPHLVRMLDAGQLPSGEPFVVMEQLRGRDLETQLAEEGPLPIADALRFMRHVCRGLADAHAVGVVHQDLKPSNLLVCHEKTGVPYVKIIDFGTTTPNGDDPEDRLLTGTPGYAAPEQLGERDDVDGRADIFAVGAILHELVTGTRAFEASTLQETLRAVLRDAPPPMSSPHGEVPRTVQAIVRRCLAKEREHRFPNVIELYDALGQAIAELNVGYQPSMLPPPPEPRADSARRATTARVARKSVNWSAWFFAALLPIAAMTAMVGLKLLVGH